MATFKPTSTSTKKKTFTPTKYAGYNTSTLRGYEYENKSALDILNEYQNKINRGEWISTEDRAKYKAAVDSYTSSGNALRSASKFYGTKYSDEEEKGWQDYLASLSGNYNSINDFYNQFENETMFDYFASPYKADFKENSAYVSTQYGKPELNIWSGIYSDTGFSDIEYDYINKNTVAEGVKLTNSQAAGPNLSGVSNSQNHSMTDDEIAIFNYLYKTKGKEAAYEYTNYLKDELNARQRQETEKMWADFAAEDPVKASLFSVFISPLQSTAYISQAADFLKNGTIDQNANYNKVLHVNTAIRDQVSKDVEQNWGAVGSFAYQTGMGMGDFLLNTAITGGNQALSLALMGTSAAANTVMSAKDRGLNDTQAFTLGTIAGAAEIAMEKIGLDALFDKALLGKDALTYVLKNALAEGGEEFGSSVINLLADVIVSGDKSQWQTAINQNIANGDDETTAWWKAVGEQALSLGADFLGGAVSGGIMGSGGAFVNATGNAINGAALKNEYGLNVGNLAYQALSLDNTNSFAQQMQNKVAKGQELSNYQVGRLAQQIENNNYEAKVKEANTTIKNRLLDLGETLWLDDVANAITKQALGEELSTFEKTVLKQSQHGSEVVKEVKNGLLFSDSNTTETATAQTQKGVPTVNSTPESASAVEANFGASAEIKTSLPKSEIAENASLIEQAAKDKIGKIDGFTEETANVMVKDYDGSVSPSEYVTTFEEAFKLGRDNAQIKELTRLSKDSGVIGRALLHAYDAGLQSRNVALEATNPENSVLQNGNESAIINTESEIIQDEGKTATESISLRRGGERIDGAYSEGQIPSVEGSTGQTASRGEARRIADSKGVSLYNTGREVRVADLGILNGSKQQKVRVIDNEADYTPSMKQAAADAKKQGLTAKFYVGDNILIEEANGSISGVRGYILGNTILVRADHEVYTSDQIARHEAGHDMIAKGQVNVKAVKKKLIEVVGKENVELATKSYAAAYVGSGLTTDEIWEELICDSLGDMNFFAGDKVISEFMSPMIKEIKAVTESETKAPTQTRGSPEGKASRATIPKRDKALYSDKASGRERSSSDGGGDSQSRSENKQKYSRELDTEYLSAVNRGDMETAQRMVDEAAKKAGYTVRGLHATNAEFNSFDISKTSSENFHGQGIYFTNSVKDLENNYENYEGPDPWQKIEGRAYELVYDKYGISYEDTLTSDSEIIGKLNECYDIAIEEFKKSGRRITAYLRFNNPLILEKGMQIPDDYAGYDGIIDKQVYENIGHSGMDENTIHYVVLNPNNIKSADPVTYDDNGKVIPLSERFNPEEKDIRYSRELDLINYINENEVDDDLAKEYSKADKSMIDRLHLINALESITDYPSERGILSDYRAMVETIAELEKRIASIDADIKVLSKNAKVNAEAIKTLKAERKMLEMRVHKADEKVLKLESTKALRGVVESEREKAYRKAKQEGREALLTQRAKSDAKLDAVKDYYRGKLAERRAAANAKLDATVKRYQEARAKGIEGRHKTAKKQAIRGVAMDLEKLLNRGTKERNVKKGERDLVAKVLELTDMLYASDDELLLNGIGTEFTKAEAEAMDDYMALYDQYHSYDNAVTANKQKRAELRQQMAEVKKQFEGVLERERKRISEANASGIFDAIIKEYESLNKSEEAYIKQAYKPEVAEYLKQMKDTIGNANLSDMSLEQLETLHKAMSLIKHLIQDSNKLFRNGKTESIETRREAIFIAIDALKNRFDKDYPEIIGKALDKINELGWNNLRPVDAFELTDANALIELYWDVISAQNTYARDVEEAKAALIKARESHGYAKWNLDDVTTFETEDGRNFNVTLGEMMSIYAYSKRDQADKHMREGGFQHEKKAIYKEKGIYKLRKKEALTYKVNDKMRLDIINSLTKEQRAYVDEVQKVLTDWGEKGNEASRIIYGIDLFTEKVYFPLESATDYLSSASTELGKTVTTASLSATGMAKATIPGASNPIILRGFDEVVLEHFDKMAKYHSYLVPIDNLRKMLDAQGKDNNNNIVSTKALIGSKLGDGASKYFQDYITDLNGGMNIGGAKNPLESFFGKSKAMSVMANISVWVQQYFSIVRAFSEVNPKYFIPFMGESFKKADMKLYAEMKKYAPITTIKEMGGFDVGSNRTIQDYVGYEGTGKAKGKAWKKFQDMLGVGAEAMDKLGWMTIWKGVKKEVAASGKYKTGSEEYFKACGERFERIIAKTQVYDSVNSKSAYMRSKNPAVKYLVSFMGEPTTILGMAEVSIIKFERAVETGDKAKIKEAGGKLAGTMAAISVSTALTSVAKSLVYALRDDDEDETYLEKYAQSLGKAFADDINIFKYIPVARDIVSAWEGFTTERPDMTLLQDVIDSVKKVINKLNDEDSTTEEIFSGYMNAALAIGNIFGIPAKNVYRDIKGLITTIANIGNGYRTDFGEKFAEGFLDTSKNKSQKLYDAIVSGDENLAKYYQSTYKDFSAYKTALRKTLRDNDERIKEAAEAKNSGDIETYESILQEIIDEGNFDSIIIEEAIDAEANSYYSDMKSDDMRIIESVMATISGDNNKRIEIEKALVEEGRFTVDLINKARESEMKSLNNLLKEAKELTARGRYSDAEAIYNDLIKKGYTKEFIEAQKNKR